MRFTNCFCGQAAFKKLKERAEKAEAEADKHRLEAIRYRDLMLQHARKFGIPHPHDEALGLVEHYPQHEGGLRKLAGPRCHKELTWSRGVEYGASMGFRLLIADDEDASSLPDSPHYTPPHRIARRALRSILLKRLRKRGHSFLADFPAVENTMSDPREDSPCW